MDAQGNGQSVRLTVRAESKSCIRAEDCEARNRPAFRLPAERILTSPWDPLPALLTLQEAASRSRLLRIVRRPRSCALGGAHRIPRQPRRQGGRILLEISRLTFFPDPDGLPW